MIQIRIHGRGGQGVVTAAEILSIAAFVDGKHAQAFPSFGSERTGAPVIAFCRISEKPIRNREPVFTPDVLLLQDSTLLHQMDVFGGLSSQGHVLINSSRSLGELHLTEFLAEHPTIKMYTLPASEIAIKHLGRPLANAALIAGFAGMTGAVSESAVEKSIKQKFSGQLGEKNVDIAKEAYAYMTSLTASV
jgi:pyruvate ferredoxin oxidoreductase gamma subunit